MLLHPTKMERCRGIPPHSLDSDPRGRDSWGVHAQMTPVSAPAASRPASTRLLDGRVLIVGGLETALPTVQFFQ
jgi:hypothetical protein